MNFQPGKKSFAKISTRLLLWYDKFGRKHLPWRCNIDAYKVWISEIMLQQTQVATVLPYYQRFLERFPTVESLAKADLSEVLSYWSGLGYYARARNLHHTAQIIHSQFANQFPKDIENLQKLPGIGRSTAGAISAIAFKQAAPILDGNVKRVLTRLYGIEGWPGKTQVANKLWQLAESLLPNERADDYTQALMDLGATICTRQQPQCISCPVMKFCHAYQYDSIEQFPSRKPKKKLAHKSVYMLLIENNFGDILLEKRPPFGIWGGLWSFPECASDENIIDRCLKFGLNVDKVEVWQPFTHTFSHFHLKITPIQLKLISMLDKIMENPNLLWYKLNQAETIATPAPVTKLLTQLGEINVTKSVLSKATERS